MSISCDATATVPNAIEGYEWLEGTWVVDSGYFKAEMVVTKNTFTINCDDERFQIKDNPINIGKAHNYFHGENGCDILALDVNNIRIAIDEESKSITLLESEYGAYTMTKTTESKEQIGTLKSDYSKETDGYNSSNKSHIFTDALYESDYNFIMFETQYQDSSLTQRQYYIVLHPFVFSEDGCRGIAYYIAYGEDKSNVYNKGIVSAMLNYYGEYEIIGNHIRVREIVQTNSDKRVESLIYTINDEDGELTLFGGFPHRRTDKHYNRQITDIPHLINDLLQKDNICRHE